MEEGEEERRRLAQVWECRREGQGTCKMQLPAHSIGQLWVASQQWAFDRANAQHFHVVVNLSRRKTPGGRGMQ